MSCVPRLACRSTRTIRVVVLAALSSTIAFTPGAFAQISTGGIRGIVRDDTGAILAGVTVEAGSPARIGGAAVDVTNTQGLYRFDDLPIGTYTVTFSLQGFATLKREGVRVEVGRTVELSLGMAISAVQETVTVSGGAPVVDTLNAGTSSTLSKDLLESVPTTRGYYLELATYTPAVAINGPPINSTIVVYGSNSDQNSYQIDGVDVSAPQSGIQWDYTSYNVIEALEVKAVGASAEYTGFQGGVVNVVTKSGSNNFRGLASVYGVPTAWVGNNTPSEVHPYHVAHQTETAMMFGGPIKTDRLWFNAILTGNWQKIGQVGVDPVSASAWWLYKPFMKITAKPSGHDQVNFTFNNMRYYLPDDVSRTNPKNTTNVYDGQNPMFMGHWARTLGSKTVLEVKGGGIYIRDNYNPVSGDFTTSGHFDFATGLYSVNSASMTRTVQDKTSVDAAVSHDADDFIKGSHDFKFGVQTSVSKANIYTANTGGTFFYDFNGPYYALQRQPAVQAGRVSQVGAFAQDNWTLNDRTTLNLGVRYDHTNGDVPSVAQLDNTNQNPTGLTFPSVANLIAFNDVSPRLGVTYKLDDVGKTVAKASYGRYYGVLRTGMFAVISPGNTVSNYVKFNARTGKYDIPFYSVNPNANFAVDPHLKDQYTDQVFVGLEREILPDFGMDISYVHKNEHNFIRLNDVGGVYVPQSYVDTFNGVSQTLSVLNRVSAGSQSLYDVTNRSDFRQSYDSVTIQANKRFSHAWQLQTSYTWQRALGYTRGTPGPGAQSFGTLNVNGFGRDPNDVINAYGNLPAEPTHAIRASATYQARYGLNLGLRYGYSTGRPFARLISVKGLAQGVRTVIAEPSGNHQLPAVNDVQVRIDKDFVLGGKTRLRVSLDLLNLANTTTVVTLRNNSSTAGALFGQYLSVLPPRQAMIGARFEF